MDILKNKSIISAVIAVVIIVAIIMVSDKLKNREGYADSINNQLNPHVKETKKDFQYLYDKKTGLLMSGSEFQKGDLEGRYVPLNQDDIPINVIAPDSFLLDDGNKGRTGLHTNLTSPLCCSAQYPLPFKLKHDKRLCNLKNFVPSNFFANNAWQPSSCLCLSKQQANMLYNRGGNA
jgi:hypothetical protein